MARYTVSEVAERTGFASSALRYYDKLGLVRPVGRSDAGYRLYDDRSVERLGFIARAKRLALTLEDITALVELWDGDECAPVQSRLAEVVAVKLVHTQHAISELAEFASQLTELSGRLSEQPHTGACNDRCACNAGTATDRPTVESFGRSAVVRDRRDPGANLTTETIPSGAEIPVVCDLAGAPDTVQERAESYRRLFADALVGRERTVAGTRFRFRAGDGIEVRVRQLANLEEQCCSFFTFTITVSGGEVLWDSTVIDDDTARAVLDEWFQLPEHVNQGVDVLHDRFLPSGLRFTADPLTRLGDTGTSSL